MPGTFVPRSTSSVKIKIMKEKKKTHFIIEQSPNIDSELIERESGNGRNYLGAWATSFHTGMPRNRYMVTYIDTVGGRVETLDLGY